jgi:hypothetical protein
MMTKDDALLRRYLLGDLTGAEQARLEKELLAEDEAFELLLATEDDLIDAYAGGGLTTDERQQFEQRYHSSAERWQRVELARALRTRLAAHVVSVPPEESSGKLLQLPAWRRRTYLALAATLALAVTTGLLGLRSARLGTRLAVLESERQDLVAELEAINQRQEDLEQNLDQELARAEQLDRELARKAEQITSLEEQLAAAPAVAAIQPLTIPFVLSPAARSAGALALVLPPAAERVELQIDLTGEDDVTSLRARLQTAQGDEIWGQTGIEAVASEWGRSATIRLPAAILASGSYVLTLEGVSAETPRREIGIYDFQVAR